MLFEHKQIENHLYPGKLQPIAGFAIKFHSMTKKKKKKPQKQMYTTTEIEIDLRLKRVIFSMWVSFCFISKFY